MLGVLLESNAKRQRRTGGAALSVAAHVAIAGLVTAFTVPRPAEPRPTIPEVRVAIVREAPTRTAEAHRTSSGGLPLGPVVKPFDLVLPAPAANLDLPSVEIPHGPPLDSLIATRSGGGGTSLNGLGKLDLRRDSTSGEWRGNEALMRVVEQSKPRYPESLRQAGIDGRVLVQFRVDTLGKVDPASVRVLSSTHELFARAVRDALGGFRFRPAEVNGQRVIALAEMPFEVSIRR
jgi:protein TonB